MEASTRKSSGTMKVNLFVPEVRKTRCSGFAFVPPTTSSVFREARNDGKLVSVTAPGSWAKDCPANRVEPRQTIARARGKLRNDIVGDGVGRRNSPVEADRHEGGGHSRRLVRRV